MNSKKKRGLKKLLRISELLSNAMGKSNVPMHQATIFLHVANSGDEGLLYKDLMKSTGLVNSTMSRNINALGEWHRLGRPGLRLVETIEDDFDKRIKRVHLTKKGYETLEVMLKENLV